MDRMAAHRHRKDDTDKAKWIQELSDKGESFSVRILEYCDEAQLAERERFWIALARSLGVDLTNMVAGGNGSTGWRPTSEQRSKMSDAQLGNKKAIGNTHRLGKFHSDAVKKRMAVAHIGRRHSEATKQRLAELRTGQKHSDKTKRKISSTKAKSGAPHGSMHGRAKLTDSDVVQMIALHNAQVTISSLSKRFAVGRTQVRRIVNRESWKHLNLERAHQ